MTGQHGLTIASFVVGLAAALLLVWVVLAWLSPEQSAGGTGGGGPFSIVRPATQGSPSQTALPEIPPPTLEPIDLQQEEEPRLPEDLATAARGWAVSALPHEEREGNPYRSFVPSEVFEEKYVEASGDDLLDAKARLEVKIAHVTQAAMDHYFDSGQAETWVADAGGQSAVGDAEDPPMPKKSYGLLMVTRSRSFDGGSRMLKGRGELPWEQYVSLYDLHDEVNWVNREAWRREKARKEALLAELQAGGAGK